MVIFFFTSQHALIIILLFSALQTSLVYAADGNTVPLTCPKMNTTKVIWLKDGLPISIKSQKQQQIFELKKKGYVLKVRVDSDAETGIYTCANFSNGRIGKNLISFNVSLIRGKILCFL